ncbi:MAG: potassium transporter TrkG [Christensenellales bacterium]
MAGVVPHDTHGPFDIGRKRGSTAGGIKVARIVMLFKGLKAEVMRAVKPRRVVTICMDGKRIDASVMRGTYGYVAAFVAICAASMLLVSLDDFDFTTTVTGVLTCIGNVGPGLSMVGPSGNSSAFRRKQAGAVARYALRPAGDIPAHTHVQPKDLGEKGVTPKGSTACGGAVGASRLRGNRKIAWLFRAVPLSSWLRHATFPACGGQLLVCGKPKAPRPGAATEGETEGARKIFALSQNLNCCHTLALLWAFCA